LDFTYTNPVAEALGVSARHSRQMLRSLREARLVPGRGANPEAKHIARVVLALGAETVSHAAAHVETLSCLVRAASIGLPDRADDMLTRLVETLPSSPVLADLLDADGGFVHLGADSVTLECLTVSGHRVCVRYGAPFSGIAHRTTVPITLIRKLILSIGNT
jgi:hypothetical protein